MAKGSKSKTSKAKTKTKTKTKKETKKIELEKKIKKSVKKVSKKEPIAKKEKKISTKKVKEPKIDVEKEEIIEEKVVEDIKEEKVEKKAEKKEKKPKKKISKKSKNKIIRLLIIAFVLSGLLVALIIYNRDSYNKNTSFITKNSILLSKPNSIFTAPVYSFAIDKKENPIEVMNLEFLEKDISYKFYDMKREELEDGNILISIPCDMEVELEYVVDEDVDTNWMYTYSYAPVFAFDYYSGDIYHEETISDNKLVLMDVGNDKKETKDKKNSKSSKNKETTADKMAYTKQIYDDKEISIGVLNNSTKSTWSSNIYQGNKNDGKHFKVDNKSTTIIYIKAPKNYDGLALAINKNGASYETWKKEYDYYEKLVSLQEEAKKSGEKSSELEDMEKEMETIHKLLDKNDELRKNYTKDDFYAIRISDMFNGEYLVKEESDINLLNITGILVLSLSVLTCIFMAIGERNKAYGRRY